MTLPNATHGESDEELFAIARSHMEKYSGAASLDRRLWDATVRIALRSATAVTPSGCEGCRQGLPINSYGQHFELIPKTGTMPCTKNRSALSETGRISYEALLEANARQAEQIKDQSADIAALQTEAQNERDLKEAARSAIELKPCRWVVKYKETGKEWVTESEYTEKEVRAELSSCVPVKPYAPE